ncbi:MAG: FMN-binding protein [Treponema sp.]|jgi:uncharacterized protein with FMN-binding domain|nr:FMN-binding protein [Treponema sp.]
MRFTKTFTGGKRRPPSVQDQPFPRAAPGGTAPLLAAALLACVLAAGCAGSALREKADSRIEIWEGIGQGWGGEIRVRLRLNATLIQELDIVSHREDPTIGGEAMAELRELVLDYQSADLDAVSGATESSAGFLAAVEDALNQAVSGPAP